MPLKGGYWRGVLERLPWALTYGLIVLSLAAWWLGDLGGAVGLALAGAVPAALLPALSPGRRRQPRTNQTSGQHGCRWASHVEHRGGRGGSLCRRSLSGAR